MREQTNYDKIKKALSSPADLTKRTVLFCRQKVDVVFINELTDPEKIEDTILRSINEFNQKCTMPLDKFLREQVLSTQELVDIPDVKTAVEKILKGYAIVCIGDKMLGVDCELITGRVVAEPPTSAVVKGPREGFVESAKVNLALIRKRLATPDLCVENQTVGKYTQTDVYVLYINSIADKKVVKEIVDKIKKIQIDGIIDSSYIADFLCTKKGTLFKQVGHAEKPDIVTAKLLEGRVAIVVDGSPFVLTLPYILFEDLQNSQDYYESHVHSNFLRALRIGGVILAFLLPGMYLALQLYHYKIFPIDFLVSILNSTQGIPFSPFTEILFIILLFEILYDASLRMPRHLGMALSIVGALILGDTAVQAGLVSPPAVMLVALSGLTFYIVPGQSEQLSELRLIFVFAGAVLGLFGIMLASIVMISHLSDFDAYGASYLAPIAPYHSQDLQDWVYRKEIRDMRTRPFSILPKTKNRVRLK